VSNPELLTHFDGVLLHQFRMEGDTLVRKQTQPNQDKIKNWNKELRKNKGALGHLSFGGLELNIPEVDYEALVIKYPDLRCKDSLTRTLAWTKFMATSEADPFRVRDRRRKRATNTP